MGAFGKSTFNLFDRLADGPNPALKVLGNQFVCGTVLRIDLQSQASQRASILAFRLENSLAITRQDREDTLHGLLSLRVGRVHYHRP